MEVLNIAHFHNRPEDLAEYAHDCGASAIVINWCYSLVGDTARALEKSGISAKLVLSDQRVIDTGKPWLTLDEDQKEFIWEVKRVIDERRENGDRGGRGFVVYGSPGDAAL